MAGERLDDRPVFFRPGGRPVGTFYKAWATDRNMANIAGRVFYNLRPTAARATWCGAAPRSASP